MKKEMIAMLLAGGQGSRLGVLTARDAKPAVPFGGKYRIIDFPLSNCINSGIDTVGVLTQYQPLLLNKHIGIGIPWDLDRNYGGVTILSPYEQSQNSGWYSGTANAIYQNIRYIDSYAPDYVLILGGDHIYKMDYQVMLEYHRSNNADVTMAAMPVSIEEASRFGILITDETGRITDFEEKPAHPRSNLASMGIYIFTWKVLREALITNKDVPGCDFGKHIIPYCHQKGDRVFCYQFHGYWKDVGTLSAYWEANMELVDLVPVFDLYQEFWRFYTKSDSLPAQYISPDASIDRCLIGDGSEIGGRLSHCIVGPNVVVEDDVEIRESIIMGECVIRRGTRIDRAIIGSGTVVGENCRIGVGEYAESLYNKKVYESDLVTVAEDSVIPAGVSVGRNTAISGVTVPEDYPDGRLVSGGYVLKGGEEDL